MSLCFDRSDHRWRLGGVVRSGGARRLLCFPLTCSKHYRCFVQMLVLCPFQNTPSTNINEQPEYKTTQALIGTSWKKRADREWNLFPSPVMFFLIISRDTKTKDWRKKPNDEEIFKLRLNFLQWISHPDWSHLYIYPGLLRSVYPCHWRAEGR